MRVGLKIDKKSLSDRKTLLIVSILKQKSLSYNQMK